MSLSFLVPVKVVSGLNAREHPMARKQRVSRERNTMAGCFFEVRDQAPPLPWRVTWERLASRRFDLDNLASSFKGLQDELAAQGGFNDGDVSYEPVYQQRKPDPARGEEAGMVRVTIETASGGG